MTATREAQQGDLEAGTADVHPTGCVSQALVKGQRNIRTATGEHRARWAVSGRRDRGREEASEPLFGEDWPSGTGPTSAAWISPHARQAIKITHRRQDRASGKTSRETVYAVTSLTSADAARRIWPAWSASTGPSRRTTTSVRDVTFHEDTATSRTGSGPANLATIRAAIIAAIKDAGYLHIPEGRRDHTTPTETLRLHGLD